LRLTAQRLTPGAEEVTALAGILESFGQAAGRTLRKLAGLDLSASTVERSTEAAGARLAEQRQAGHVFGPPQPWAWHTDRQGRTCAYVSVDWTGILRQGPQGAQCEGRMVAVGMIYNPHPQLPGDAALAQPCDGVRYLAGLYPLADLGQQLRRQAAQVGMEEATQWLALSDGGNGLEEFFDTHFPRAVKILDFQHAAGHLASLAKLAGSGATAERWLTAWCHTLKHAGGATLLRVLGRWGRRSWPAAVRAELERVRNYVRKNLQRMDYPTYLRQGWHIGSGAVESACKTVVNQRLCQGGMRWSDAGSDAVAHLRALYRSDADQWDAFWHQAV